VSTIDHYLVTGDDGPHEAELGNDTLGDAVREAMNIADRYQHVRIFGCDAKGDKVEEHPTYAALRERDARASAYTFGPDTEHAISLVKIPWKDTWKIRRGSPGTGTSDGVWDGEVWEYRGQTEWAFNAGWTECERIVAANIWPIGNVRPWEEKL
jgi:hypothetical protein